jgi:selenocysteine lyase/cysteine desulfurase
LIAANKAMHAIRGAIWRWESNPQESSPKWHELQALVEREQEAAADALHADDPDWHSLSPSTLELAELIRC